MKLPSLFLTTLGLLSCTAGASVLTDKHDVHIAKQSLEAALQELSRQTGVQIARFSDSIDGKLIVGPVSGTQSVQEALTALLQSKGLTFRVVSEKTIAVVDARDAIATSSSDAAGRSEDAAANPPHQSMRLARNEAADNAPSSGNKDRAPGEQLDEIVVTAQKREERLMDVPLSIAVIGGQEIDRRGLIGMEDYLRSIPGVNQIDTGDGANAIVIRGVTTSPQAENFAAGPTVATYFDEAPITGAAGTGGGGVDVRPVDMERIELLRGPQGTTFGSSALGGALRLIPVKPKLDAFGAKVAANYSDTSGRGGGNSMIQGVLNIPIVADKLAVRAVGYRYDESGFYRNIAGNDPATIAQADAWGIGTRVRGFVQDDVGHMQSVGGRLSVLWRPTDRFDIYANYLNQKIEQDGSPVATVGAYEQIKFPLVPQSQVRGEDGEVGDTTIHLANAVLTYDLGWAGLTASSSWLDGGITSAIDQTSGFGVPVSGRIPTGLESFTSEVRIASRWQGRFHFLGGVFYEDVDNKGHTVNSPASSVNPYLTDPLQDFTNVRNLKQRALFGELSYDLSDKLKATVGGRYFQYDKSETTLREGGFYRVPLGGGIPVTVASDEGGSKFKANLSYKPHSGSMIYASWAQGFRLGRPTAGLPSRCDSNADGVVDGTSTSLVSTRTIDSDFLDNYELGGKFSFLDQRVLLDASIYHIKWQGLPILAIAAACGVSYTANVGAAKSDGAELHATMLITQGLRLDVGAGYTKAELTKPGLGAPAGARLPGSPKVNANLAVQQEFNLVGHKSFVRLDALYTEDFYGDLLQSALTRAGDYVKVDARAGIALGSVQADLFIRNLTDEDAFTWRGLSNSSSFFGYRMRPRTYGVELSYSFE